MDGRAVTRSDGAMVVLARCGVCVGDAGSICCNGNLISELARIDVSQRSQYARNWPFIFSPSL